MQLAVALLAMAWTARSDDCFDVQYSADTVTTSAGNQLVEIALLDEMHFEFDVVINSFPAGWASVFNCGSDNSIRTPGFWLHPDSGTAGAEFEGFHISFSTLSNTNAWINPGPELVTGQSYHVELDVTQSSRVVTIDGVVRAEDTAFEAHNTYDSLPCYSGDPWYDAADVVITNLVISSPAECSVDCSALDLDTFLSSCSSNYDDLVAGIGTNSGNVGTNSYNIEENSQKIVTLTSANAALSARIEENSQNTVTLISANVADIAANAEDIAMIKSQRLNNQDATPGVIFDFSNTDLLIMGLLVINLTVIALSTYICVSGKAVKYQPVKAYGSE
mmetsp:Transcript_33410/g.54387  ORF Transcript_33410/g.54387 Transcript_33410/m.54387 type:complete len:333 (+) Transcript_33410:146-1144(+)